MGSCKKKKKVDIRFPSRVLHEQVIDRYHRLIVFNKVLATHSRGVYYASTPLSSEPSGHWQFSLPNLLWNTRYDFGEPEVADGTEHVDIRYAKRHGYVNKTVKRQERKQLIPMLLVLQRAVFTVSHLIRSHQN